MITLEYADIIRKRKIILAGADNHKVYTNHSNNVKNIRVCSICGRQLTTYVPRSNSYITICKHYHYSYWHGQLVGNLCYNPKACYKRIKDKG